MCSLSSTFYMLDLVVNLLWFCVFSLCEGLYSRMHKKGQKLPRKRKEKEKYQLFSYWNNIHYLRLNQMDVSLSIQINCHRFNTCHFRWLPFHIFACTIFYLFVSNSFHRWKIYERHLNTLKRLINILLNHMTMAMASNNFWPHHIWKIKYWKLSKQNLYISMHWKCMRLNFECVENVGWSENFVGFASYRK